MGISGYSTMMDFYGEFYLICKTFRRDVFGHSKFWLSLWTFLVTLILIISVTSCNLPIHTFFVLFLMLPWYKYNKQNIFKIHSTQNHIFYKLTDHEKKIVSIIHNSYVHNLSCQIKEDKCFLVPELITISVF